MNTGGLTIRDFKKLQVWQKAHQLTLEVYKNSAQFPKPVIFGLTSQIRRAAVSIEANIAEGCGRWGDGDFGRFLQIAAGSGSELECHLLIAKDLHLLTEAEELDLQRRLTEVAKMLTALRQTVADSNPLARKAAAARGQGPEARS